MNRFHSLIRRVVENNPDDVCAFINAHVEMEETVPVTNEALSNLVIAAFERTPANKQAQFLQTFLNAVQHIQQ